MNELTDEQIENIYLDHRDQLPNIPLIRAIITADRALQASRVAEPAVAIGWKWVPLEPTAEMLQAGQDTPVSESDEDALEDYKAVYRAMLAAAPHPQQIARLDKDAEIERLKDALTFVERWANHHAQKPHVTAAEALSCIQHYPEIEAITEKRDATTETRDPYAEITALKAERDALRKNDARYRFVVGSTDHSVAKWHDCEGWYAIEEANLDVDVQAQEVQP